MRRDVCYYFEIDSVSLYTAYLKAAKSPPFERTCEEKPYHTFSFGLNYSVKYNMNGGACTLRFIPMKTGAAVNLRFSIAQLAGARYEKYADYLTEQVVEAIHIPAQRCNINIDDFMKADNLVFTPPSTQTTFSNQFGNSALPPQTPNDHAACPSCRREVSVNDSFCKYCGSQITKRPLYCSHCGTQADCNALFCIRCGNKL